MAENSNTKKVKIALVGSSGKMGRATSLLVEKDPDLTLVTDDPDVVIDFSSPEGTEKAIAMQKPLVCGTTGLSKAIFEKMTSLSKEVPVLHSPNFSLGMALLFEIVEKMGRRLKKFSSISISETHHTQKKDTPSGTALRLCSLLDEDPRSVASHRIGDVIGEHQIQFEFEHERLQLLHTALSREAFAAGAIQAAKFIFDKPAKLYTLSEIFD